MLNKCEPRELNGFAIVTVVFLSPLGRYDGSTKTMCSMLIKTMCPAWGTLIKFAIIVCYICILSIATNSSRVYSVLPNDAGPILSSRFS